MFDCNSFLHRKGWTQKDLAKRLDIGTSTVGMWCTGKSTPSYSVIVELSRLGMTLQEIFDEEICSILMKNSELIEMSQGGNFDSPEFIDSVVRVVERMKSEGKV